MMKIFLRFSVLFVSFFFLNNHSFAQTLYAPGALGNSSNANVGIGTSSPSAKLHVVTNNSTGGLLINGVNGGPGPVGGGTSTTPYFVKGLLNNAQYLFIDATGHADFGPGLGSYSNANTYLNVRQNFGVFNDNSRFLKLDYLLQSNGASIMWNNPQSGNTDNNLNFRFGSNSNAAAIMSLSPTGVVGIGTTNFAGGFHKLYVGGSIIAEEVTAKLEADWPDYVFSEDYDMMSNEELSSFIDENGHLPGIPTAAEVSQNGIELAKTEALLLEKIEELTLRLLEMDKELKALKAAQDAK